MKKNGFDHKKIEEKWKKAWEKEKLFKTDISASKVKFYNLYMFPYPSSEGMHAGHAMSSTGSDIYGKYMRMNGKNVLQPMGYDSFGIHSENFALKIGEHPEKMLQRTIENFTRQFLDLGHGYDWSKKVITSDPDYYRWTQWIIAELFKAGLAYRKSAKVNWCPSCKTVLADEQVMTPAQAYKKAKNADGSEAVEQENAQICERCGTIVERKALKQWFLRITDYADRLLSDLEKIDWSDRVVTAQRNWIGKSKGLTIHFKFDGGEIPVWTKYWETVFGTTFLVVSPEFAESKLLEFIEDDKKDEAEEYIRNSLNKSIDERANGKEKTGLDIGIVAINPVNKNRVPVYIADYVISEVGTGAVMGVPAHDTRDFEFAKRYKLEIIQVVDFEDEKINREVKNFEAAHESSGKIINSGQFDGMDSKGDGKNKMAEWMIKEGYGEWETNYHLRDWLISRQRYWGAPIPFIYCENCAKKGLSYFTKNKAGIRNDQSDWDHAGWFVDENDVRLPHIKDFKPEGSGNSPLANHPEFYEAKCPNCDGLARRETDVMDTFVDSSWYFLRYPSVGSKSEGAKAFDPKITKKWLPVDLYFGGAEHSVLHLMYARFVTKALFDLKYLDFDEPFPRFFAHGLMIKDGAKMSKSRGNVVNPDEYIEKFGADTLRLYVSFVGPMDSSPDFRDSGIEGMSRFVKKVFKLIVDAKTFADNDPEILDIKIHQTIDKVSKDVQNFRYNTAISSIMELVTVMQKNKSFSKTATKTLIQLLAPFAPFVTEELWEIIGEKGSVHKSTWPQFDPNKLTEKVINIVIQINGKVRDTITIERANEKDKEFVISEAKKQQKVAKWLEGGKIKNTIYVPGKILNFVI